VWCACVPLARSPGLEKTNISPKRVTTKSHCMGLHGRMGAWGLECVCGDVFCAQCDVEPSSCTVAWILLMLSVAMHAWRCCALDCDNGSESDDETNTMYTFKKPILVCPG
jgi:hypothetical protein